jgi:hypothetical protein
MPGGGVQVGTIVGDGVAWTAVGLGETVAVRGAVRVGGAVAIASPEAETARRVGVSLAAWLATAWAVGVGSTAGAQLAVSIISNSTAKRIGRER